MVRLAIRADAAISGLVGLARLPRVVKASLDNYLGLYDRIGMDASIEGPEAVEGFLAFRERRSPDWVHPELRVDGRL